VLTLSVRPAQRAFQPAAVLPRNKSAAAAQVGIGIGLGFVEAGL
jgi:hypothetical protein